MWWVEIKHNETSEWNRGLLWGSDTVIFHRPFRVGISTWMALVTQLCRNLRVANLEFRLESSLCLQECKSLVTECGTRACLIYFKGSARMGISMVAHIRVINWVHTDQCLQDHGTKFGFFFSSLRSQRFSILEVLRF